MESPQQSAGAPVGGSAVGNRNKIAITGGSGFIGSRLAPLLKEASIPFRIGDLSPGRNFPEAWENCDVQDLSSVLGFIQGSDVIINLAAEHRDDVRPLSRYHDVNVGGAEQICLAARQAGVRTILFTSSVAVYGFHPRPTDEDGPFEPFNAYGQTKLEAEGVYRKWAAEDPSRTLVIVRPTVVFGEGNRGNVYNLMKQVATGRFLMVGAGTNVKSMAYVGNVAAFLKHSLTFGPGVHVFNYVDGPDISTRELVTHIRQCLGKNETVRAIPKPLAMAGGRCFDTLARATGRRFPISAIRVRKFCESTQFLADRLPLTGFSRPYSLLDALTRTISFEFPHTGENSSREE